MLNVCLKNERQIYAEKQPNILKQCKRKKTDVATKFCKKTASNVFQTSSISISIKGYLNILHRSTLQFNLILFHFNVNFKFDVQVVVAKSYFTKRVKFTKIVYLVESFLSF